MGTASPSMCGQAFFPAVFRRTELGFFLSFPALSPYLYSYSFLTALLHYSSIWLYLMVSFTLFCFFLLYGLASVLQYLLPDSHAVSNDSWVSLFHRKTVPEFDTQCSFCSCCFLTVCCLGSLLLVLCTIILASGIHTEGWELPGMSW